VPSIPKAHIEPRSKNHKNNASCAGVVDNEETPEIVRNLSFVGMFPGCVYVLNAQMGRNP
jgi:hypothetical protein